jgi:Domain of unknown function (DUF4340)
MKPGGLLIATFVLAALVGALYWSNHHKPSESSEVSADIAPKVLSLNKNDVTGVEIKKDGQDSVTLAKDSSGNWQITAPQPLHADQDAVSGVVATLSDLSSDRLVDAKAKDLSQYGLTHPSVEADVTEKNGKTAKVLIGDTLPTGYGAYAALAGGSRVFSIPSYTKTAIDKGPSDLRDKRLITEEADKVSRVELEAKKQDLEFGRDTTGWQILRPEPLRADSYAVGELVRQLTQAKMDLSGSQQDLKKTAVEFSSGTPVAVASVTDDAGTQEIQIHKNKTEYFAKSSVVPGVYEVSSVLGEGVDKGLEDFRNKKVFDFGYEDPNKIEMHDGSKVYFLTRSGEDWWNGKGQKLDPDSVESFLDRVRDLSATKFPETGFKSPEITLDVLSKNGKLEEKVFIAKDGADYIAKRANEPSLYELDSSSVQDLQKAAADLKQVTPVKATATKS